VAKQKTADVQAKVLAAAMKEYNEAKDATTILVEK